MRSGGAGLRQRCSCGPRSWMRSGFICWPPSVGLLRSSPRYAASRRWNHPGAESPGLTEDRVRDDSENLDKNLKPWYSATVDDQVESFGEAGRSDSEMPPSHDMRVPR